MNIRLSIDSRRSLKAIGAYLGETNETVLIASALEIARIMLDLRADGAKIVISRNGEDQVLEFKNVK